MRIDGWRIEGFGIFRDCEVRGLAPGLSVFLGPNEAGKSTLLAFLRGVLFGFPSRRSRAPQYPPLRGGRHGGCVYLCGSRGETLVERVMARRSGLRLNGAEAENEDLQALLGGADESLFCSVFAFGLSEMQSFEWLRAEQVRERIFSAGIAGAGASARQAIDQLEAEAASFYRPRGASRLKELGEQIDQAEQRLKLALADSERYLSLEEEQEKWIARAAALSEEEQDLRSRRDLLEALIASSSDHERALEELGALAPVDEFPSEPEVRLAELTGRVQAARAVAARIEEEKSPRDEARAKLGAPDEKVAGIAESVEEFHSRLALHRDRLESLPAARQKAKLTRWLALGAFLAFAAGWLTARGEVTAGLTTLLAGLSVGGLVLYQRTATNARIARLERQIADWEKPVRQWLVSFTEGEPLIAEFLTLRERCAADREVRSKLAAFDAAAAGIESRLESARTEVMAAEGAIEAFFKQAGARDEQDFQSRLELFRKRQELRRRIAVLEFEVSSGPPGEWRSESSRLRLAIEQVRAERDAAIGEQRLGRETLGRIAESAAIPSIQAELECLGGEQAAALREWRIATLARELVARTLQEFTHSRQPAVLEEASAAFARVTGGAYQRILQHESAENLVVLDSGGQAKRPEELSRGTAEQLYLCLRLALASEFALRAESLPLIMDDVLVNFDPERARAMARELVLFSERRQILIFTCHPATAALFTEVAPETGVLRMERYGSAAAQ